ncbi:unnamed protein product [Ixodes hexagonus]
MVTPKLVVLTGSPGAGKTTLVKLAVESLTKHGVSVSGFYTAELREGGRRIGFDVISTTGKRGPLARIRQLSEGGVGPSVGQYCVNIASFEAIALECLQMPGDVVVLDEVGKMELFSERFQQRVQQLISSPDRCILVTVPVAGGRPLPLVERIRVHQSATVIEVNRENRGRLLVEVLSLIHEAIRK